MVIDQVFIRVICSPNFIPIIYQYKGNIYNYTFDKGLNAFNRKELYTLKPRVNTLINLWYIPSLAYKKVHGKPTYETT